jgi:hypothetical protein
MISSSDLSRSRFARRLASTAVPVVLALALGACSAYPWRPATGPLASVAVAAAPLRLTTRPLANDLAHRYVLSWARVQGDSLVGVAVQEYRQDRDGRWSFVRQDERERRVAVATADIAEVSRQVPEPSAARNVTLLLGLTALAYAVVWGLSHPKGGT